MEKHDFSTAKVNLSDVVVLVHNFWAWGGAYTKKDNTLRDAVTASIFWILAVEFIKRGGNGSLEMSSLEISRRLGFGDDDPIFKRSTIRRKLIGLAHWGLVTVENEWRLDGSGKNKAQKIVLNPTILTFLTSNRKAFSVAQKKAEVKRLVELAKIKGESGEESQGFYHSYPYGDKPPEGLGEGLTDEAISEKAAAEAKRRAREKEERERWRTLGDQFITASARLWTSGNIARGFGRVAPTWHGDPRTMPKMAKVERYELGAAFEKYGCKLAGLAWYSFCFGIPKIDDSGRPTFTITAPHRQYATQDRRPSQFTKYLNSIFIDDLFVELAKEKWERDGLPTLREFYGDDLLKVDAKSGNTSKDFIGFEIGGEASMLEAYQFPPNLG